MRILLKGGVWKNSEDEILKAAVMKYGKNQWARVASLMNRKSAKQCKARWYEWLDPSIKKTDWTREEEEKLLHLAKLMPNQWRTIAPIVGRTAVQCIEHYERLLDQAQAETGEGEGGSSEDARRLRPGEIDPTPETKPARPDPIDMDEDDLEMLAEARARLANTKGKKAKRKARERMLENARRLSTLQKRRELKAAGIESRLNFTGGKKRKFIDYAREIPFQKVVPAGFFDVSDENARGEGKRSELDPQKYGLELSKLEGQTARLEEEKARKRDANYVKKMMGEDAPRAVSLLSELNDPTSLRRRAPLSLPAPQVTEGELEEIVKLTKALPPGGEGGLGLLMPPPADLPPRLASGGVMGGLLPPGGLAQQATPLRTPLAEDVVLQEARNQLRMRGMAPLLQGGGGGEGQDLPPLYEGTGFGGVEPRRGLASTPLHTPSLLGGEKGGMTPGGVSLVSSRGGRGGGAALGAGPSLRSILSSLPEPEFTYEVALPAKGAEEEEEERERKGGRGSLVDRGEREAAEERARVRKEREAWERRSRVLKRELPRPSSLSSRLASPTYPQAGEVGAASLLINEEALRLMRGELLAHPPEGVKAAALLEAERGLGGRGEEEEEESLSLLSQAEQLIKEEMERGEEGVEERYLSLLLQEREGLVYLPSKGWARPANRGEVLLSLRTEFSLLSPMLSAAEKKGEKIEKKLSLLTAGYEEKEKTLLATLSDLLAQNLRTAEEVRLVQEALERETERAERRVLNLKREVEEAQEKERESQERYGKLTQYALLCGMDT